MIDPLQEQPAEINITPIGDIPVETGNTSPTLIPVVGILTTLITNPITNPVNDFSNNTNLTPVSSPTEIEYSIEGTVVDSTNPNKKISGAKISTNDQNQTTSKINGQFILKGKTTTDKKISISVSLKGYTPQNFTPYFGDGTIKSNLGVIQLQLIQKSLDQDKINSSLLTDNQIKGLTKSIKTSSSFIQKKLTTSIINVKSRLIPLILTLIAGFGVTQVNKLSAKGTPKISDIQNQTTCPTQAELTRIISRKNRLVKQLNRLFKVIQSTEKFINSNKKFIDITSKTILGLDIASLALPSSIPPGIGVPVGIINKSGDIINLLKNQIKVEQGKIDNLASPLTLLKSVIAQALQYLNLLDNLIQYCYPDANQEQISAELTAITTDESNQESPVVTNVNGFTMGVETEPQISTLSIKRRRATATNKQGVVMLTGEWSFSSIDQILIDELVFYIQTNDLRAD
jgi:hypothetical protein